MSNIRIGDTLRLKTYEGHADFGLPTSRSVFSIAAEGKVTSIRDSKRFGESVEIDGDTDNLHYLDDYEVERIDVTPCTACSGRGFVATEPADDIVAAEDAHG